MKFNKEETENYFNDPVEERYFTYLEQRGIVSSWYIQSLREGKQGVLQDNGIVIADEEYSVECILGSGKIDIFDLIRNNEIYGVSAEEGTVIAILLGDDYLFLKPNDERIYFCCRDTEKVIVVAKDYQELDEMIKYKEEE